MARRLGRGTQKSSGAWVMDRNLRRGLIEIAYDTSPHEACGLIVGVGDAAWYLKRMRNVHPNPTNFFAMDPDEQLAVWEEVESRRQQVLGYFHSHVNTPAEPSETDLRWAVPALLSVIVSLADNKPDVRVWAGQIPYEGDIFRQR